MINTQIERQPFDLQNMSRGDTHTSIPCILSQGTNPPTNQTTSSDESIQREMCHQRDDPSEKLLSEIFPVLGSVQSFVQSQHVRKPTKRNVTKTDVENLRAQEHKFNTKKTKK